MSGYNQSYRKHLIGLQLPFLYGELYKPSDLVGLLETALTLC